MAAEGAELLADVGDLAVMGFAEVVSRLPYFLRLRRRVWDALDRETVDLVLPIDYPGFNLRLAERAHRRGLRVLYFIAPQVWAWHGSRAEKLSRVADHIAVILPFESSFFQEFGAQVSFVGHPLLDVPQPAEPADAWASRCGLPSDRPILALYPGSRAQELARHLELFSEVARSVVARRPEVQPVFGMARGVDRSAFSGIPWPIVAGDSGLMHHATAALVKSGTTTLQMALAGTPMVVAYRVNPLTYALARRLVDVPHIALANLVAERGIVPELIQHHATVAALTEHLLPLLDRRSDARRRMTTDLAEVRARLGEPGAAKRVATIAEGLLRAWPR
jgi:lipid-A-disaccharide synthase